MKCQSVQRRNGITLHSRGVPRCYKNQGFGEETKGGERGREWQYWHKRVVVGGRETRDQWKRQTRTQTTTQTARHADVHTCETGSYKHINTHSLTHSLIQSLDPTHPNPPHPSQNTQDTSTRKNNTTQIHRHRCHARGPQSTD